MNNQLKLLYKTGAIAAWISLALIPVQIIVFFIWPPPLNVQGFFDLFSKNKIIGLLNLDLLYMITVILLGLLYVVFHEILSTQKKSLSLLALFTGLIGVAAYFSSNIGFEVMSLAQRYELSSMENEQSQLIAAGEALLATYKGTAFNAYYVLNGISLILFSLAMIGHDAFGKKIGFTGLIAGTLMLVPSTAGNVGLVFAFLSLIPTSIWFVMIAMRLHKISKRSIS